ncbi:MAG: hypothetical protein Q4A92_05950 [Corynebacterium sp.]|nr:hypothetical protein [Corynebacterium sp.]
MSDSTVRFWEDKATKWVAAIALVATIAVNTIANTMRIGGVTTGEVSQKYPNLFTPSGFTFSIWGIIYTLLLLYVFYQFSAVRRRVNSRIDETIYNRIGVLFIASSLLNIGWIFAWHYRVIDASLLLIFGLFIVLSMIVRKVHQITFEDRTRWDYFGVVLPFMVYFGWITVALVANTKAWLVSIGWSELYDNEPFWFAVAVVLGLSMGIWNSMYLRDVSYALVLLWAVFGIFMRHIGGLDNATYYAPVMAVLIVAIVALLANTVVTCMLQQRARG